MTARIAFQGERGAFSEEALLALFGPDVSPAPHREFHDVGEAVASGRVDAGLLPVENTLAGSVAAAYDVLAGSELRVIGEVVLPIRHCLLGTADASIDRLRRVISHPVALAQCTRFLRAHPHIEALAVYDTAGAAQEVARVGDSAVAAIASCRAAPTYQLAVLREDIQDRPDNQTRFFAIAKPDRHAAARALLRAAPPTVPSRRKTAVLLETDNRPGALVEALTPFARRGINLTKLESRPGPAPWTYRFVLEIESDDDDAERAALDDVRARAASLRVLGSFPPAARLAPPFSPAPS